VATLLFIEDFVHFAARDYPFYGIQWHPEKANYIWFENSNINHDASAIRVSQYIANFIVAEGLYRPCFINTTVLVNILFNILPINQPMLASRTHLSVEQNTGFL